MTTNKEWLESLSDEQLAEEIRWGRILSESPGNHRDCDKRNYEQALFEQWKRERKQPHD